MKNYLLLLLLCLPVFVFSAPQEGRTTINLNGTWQFDQTVNAFPPAKFTRTIPVPGLVHLAEPKIEDYDKFFKRPDKVEVKDQHNLYNIDYTPRYSWYRKMVFIPKELEGKEGMITVKKSQYVTQIYVNGTDMGTSMACFSKMSGSTGKITDGTIRSAPSIQTGSGRTAVIPALPSGMPSTKTGTITLAIH